MGLIRMRGIIHSGTGPLLLILLRISTTAYSQIVPDKEREIPFESNMDFYLNTPVGPYWDVESDMAIHDFIRESQILDLTNQLRKKMYDEQVANLKAGDSEPFKYDYRKIVKTPKAGPKFSTIADWYLYYKGVPISESACCVIVLPALVAGLIQMRIESRRSKSTRVSRRTWEFPLVPVLLLQQTRREYLLRKKTVRRFCIQWEVGRINIRMNTRLVDLKQILHPPRNQKKVHKYTTWRIIRLIVRFNAFLAMRKAAIAKQRQQQITDQKKRLETWKQKIASSRYIQEREDLHLQSGPLGGPAPAPEDTSKGPAAAGAGTGTAAGKSGATAPKPAVGRNY